MAAPVGFNVADLDSILLALQSLKESGGQIQDFRFLWCSNGLLHIGKGDTFVKESPANAKSALSKLKSSSKALSVISKSLDDAIQRVTERYARPFRVSGFKFLPDDVIARIFELHHEDARETPFPYSITIRTSQVLASVCQRFRRIALRIPALWEEVSTRHGPKWIIKLTERTQHPSIYIENYHLLKTKSITNFLQLVHPSKQWRGLTIRYHEAESSRSIYECLTSEHKGEFDTLKSLELSRECLYGQDDDEATQAGRPSTMLSTAEREMMKNWEVLRLKRLVTKNLIPHTLMCYNLKELDMKLTRSDAGFYWDLSSLYKFFWQLHCLETLSICVSGARLFSSEETDFDGDEDPRQFLYLTSFTIEVQSLTDPTFVKKFMNSWDAPSLSSLSVTLRYNSERKEESDPDAWLDAIFKSSSLPNAIRTYPNVEKFSLLVEDAPRYPSYETMLRALPRVRDLSLELPECSEPPLDDLAANYGCLRDLRSLRMKNCIWMEGAETANFIDNLHDEDKLKDFEEFEVKGCNKLGEQEEGLRDLLGDKLVWKS